jgi:hypothetical protein
MSLSALIIIWLMIQFPVGMAVGKFIGRRRWDEGIGVNAQGIGVNAHKKRAGVSADDLDVA